MKTLNNYTCFKAIIQKHALSSCNCVWQARKREHAEIEEVEEVEQPAPAEEAEVVSEPMTTAEEEEEEEVEESDFTQKENVRPGMF